MFEEQRSVWKKYRRRPGQEHVHPVILVAIGADSKPVPAVGSRTEVQCSTIDRIPFTLSPKKLADLFEEAPE